MSWSCPSPGDRGKRRNKFPWPYGRATHVPFSALAVHGGAHPGGAACLYLYLACRAPSLCVRRVVWSCLARIIYILGRTQSEFKSLLFPQPPPSLLAGDAPPPGVPPSLPTSISPIPQHSTFVPPMVCIQCLLFYIIANALVFLTV